MCAHSKWHQALAAIVADDERWLGACRDKVEHPGRSIAWGRWAIVGDEEDGFGGQGGSDSGAGFEPAPDLDHSNEEVRESLKDWLRWLHTDVGFSGWRLDYVKVPLLHLPA